MATKETKKTETTALATYGEWSPEQMQKEAKDMATGGDFWKAPVGKTAVRFLPPKIGWPSPFVIQHQHFIRMPGMERPITFCCPKMHEGKKCVACSKADKLETSGNARDEKMARTLRPQKRVMASVIVDPKNETAKPCIWTFGTKVFNQLKSIREDDEGGGNFLDPIKGFNIIVTRVGTGKDDTVYTLIPSRSIGQIANMDWIDVQGDLRKLVKIPTVEQQERLLAGEDPKEVWGEARKQKREDAPGDDDSNVIDVDSKPGRRTAEDDLFDDEVDLD